MRQTLLTSESPYEIQIHWVRSMTSYWSLLNSSISYRENLILHKKISSFIIMENLFKVVVRFYGMQL